MLNTVTAAAEKVAGAAVFATWTGNTLGNLVPFRWVICFLITFKNLCFGNRVAGTGRKLFVGSGLFVTDQTVNSGRIGKIEIPGVFPAVSGVAGCATSLVALNIDSEVVDGQPTFSQLQVFFSGRIHPGPVNRFVKLSGCFGMAGKTCFGDFGTGFELLLQSLVFGMVRRYPELFRLRCLLRHNASGGLIRINRFGLSAHRTGQRQRHSGRYQQKHFGKLLNCFH